MGSYLFACFDFVLIEFFCYLKSYLKSISNGNQLCVRIVLEVRANESALFLCPSTAETSQFHAKGHL